MRLIAPVLLTLLAACSSASPAFRDAAPVRVAVGPSTFDVRVVGHHAQAIRLSREWAPRTLSVAPRAAAAIAAVSGCDVPRLWGDQAMLEAALICTARSRAAEGVPRAHDCRAVPTRQRWTEVACTPRGRVDRGDVSVNTETAASG